MPDIRAALEVIALNRLLHDAIRIGHPVMRRCRPQRQGQDPALERAGVISQPEPALYIQVPISATTVAVHSTVNALCGKGLQGEPEGLRALPCRRFAVACPSAMIVATYSEKHTTRRDCDP